MAKRFKLRISRVMTSFQTCNSKDPSTLPSDPLPSFLLQLSSPTKPHHHHRSSFKRHVSSAFTSTGCGFCFNKNSHTRSQPEFKWQKEDKWHVVAIKACNDDDDNTPRQKIYNSSASGHSSDDLFPPPPPPTAVAAQRKLRIRKKKTTGGGVRLRVSTSSAETGLFSSEADESGSAEESETLVSTSRSLSTSDSSNPTSMRKPKTKKKKNSYKRRSEKSRGRASGVDGGGGGSGGESPARLSVFKRLIPCGVLEGKVKESYAVVKKSEDPKEDFKRSMMEMVVEKQMFEERELEQLLECFLSLNSRQHHGVIVEAFTEIWEALFSTCTVVKKKSSTASVGHPGVSVRTCNS